MARRTALTELWDYLTDRKSRREWALAAQDGIVATAGILLGFAGAGAGDATLVIAATAATVAGMLSAGGAEWAEAAAEREAQLSALQEEKTEYEQRKGVGLDDIVAYYEQKGLSRGLAIRVANQLITRSPLKAALETEHGILRVSSRAEVIFTGIGSAVAYALGAAIPFCLTYFLPLNIETWLIFAAVFTSLILIAAAGAHAGHMNVRKSIVRALTVGVVTIAVSYLVGEAAF